MYNLHAINYFSPFLILKKIKQHCLKEAFKKIKLYIHLNSCVITKLPNSIKLISSSHYKQIIQTNTRKGM